MRDPRLDALMARDPKAGAALINPGFRFGDGAGDVPYDGGQ